MVSCLLKCLILKRTFGKRFPLASIFCFCPGRSIDLRDFSFCSVTRYVEMGETYEKEFIGMDREYVEYVCSVKFDENLAILRY